jgi:ketosteroid isomerase-like protein
MPQESAAAEDRAHLIRLNATYIACVRSRNTGEFDRILAEDFLCSQPDGSLVDKRTFLDQVARSSPLRELSIDDVRVRILGDVALIHAATAYALAGGERRHGRYTDVWARRNGRWLAVSAHVTR